MTRFKKRNKKRISKVLHMVITLIFFLTFLLITIYSKLTSSKLIDASFIKLNEFMDNFLSNKINYDLLKDDVIKDIIVINKNKEGEILYVTYDLDKAYYALEIVTKKLESSIKSLENGTDDTNYKNIVTKKNGIALKMPFLISLSNPLISNLAPSIYVPINFVGSILTNIKTKITDYGINNALVEIYVTIVIDTNLIAPIVEKSTKINYDVLIASSIINGRVPEVYGGIIQSKSNSYSKVLE